jgi:hypothetical protein
MPAAEKDRGGAAKYTKNPLHPAVQPIGRPPILFTVEKLQVVGRLHPRDGVVDHKDSIILLLALSCLDRGVPFLASWASEPRAASALYLLRRCRLAGSVMVS